MKLPSKLFVPVLFCSLTASTFAGPDWDEGLKDAGTTPATAQPVSGSTNTAVTRVRGGTSATALVGIPDLVDLYLVKTGGATTEFRFDMNMVSGGAPVWNARLTIFQKVNAEQCTAKLAVPLATVVKFSNSKPWPILDGSANMVAAAGYPAATLGSLMSTNTEYYIAISGLTNMPMGMRETCTTGTPKVLFLNSTGNGMYRPSTDDLNYRLSGWMDPQGAATGEYSIPVSGMYPIPASSCSSSVPVILPVDLKNFDFGFAPAITGSIAFPCAPSYYPNREFFFLWTANCAGPAEVSTCGLTQTDSGLEVFELDACDPDPCMAAASIACNDQCGTVNASLVTFTAESGRQYLVRLTRLSGNATTGQIRFTCTPPLSSRDLNGDGTVDGADLALMLASWGTSGN